MVARIPIKQSEFPAELKKTYQRFHHLVNSTPLVIYSTTYGPKHTCTFVSDKFLEMFGYPPGLMMNNPKFWISKLHPEDRAATIDTVEQQLRKRGFGTVEYRFMNNDGDYSWISDSFSVAYDENEIPFEIVGSWTDITMHKETMEEATRLLTAINATDDSILITDTDGTILYVNPAFSRITGYSYQEAIGRNPKILKSDHQSEEFYRELWETLKRGEVFRSTIIK